MAGITTLGRVVLIVLNSIFLLVSLAFIAAGAVLKFFGNKVIDLVGKIDAVDENTRDTLFIPKLDQLDELPFLAELGLALLVFGCLLFVIAFCACCGACCKLRPLLIAFIVLMAVLVLAQATVGGLFLKKGSSLHKMVKDKVGKEIEDKYDETDTNDVFSMAINLLNYLLDCCGINGVSDFPNDAPAMSCCKRTVMENTPAQCATPTAPYANFNTEGCYDKLLDKVLANMTLAIIVLVLVLLLQVAEIVFAVLLVKEAGKVGPV